jgi:hypothetical protein
MSDFGVGELFAAVAPVSAMVDPAVWAFLRRRRRIAAPHDRPIEGEGS